MDCRLHVRFATLVLDFGREPGDLLRGGMLSSARIRNWFEDVLHRVGNDEQRLLRALSECGAASTLASCALCRLLELADGERVFDNLQRSCLVLKCTPYRFGVHHLVALCAARLCRKTIARTSTQRSASTMYGEHGKIKNGLLREDDFVCCVRACRHFQRANAHHQGREYD